MHDAAARPLNRLQHESSLYLRQHASNPVDWFPWGEEAIARARSEQRPIFLSIGYSACHWCHVMEHESFENPQVAEILNTHFVSIKVDREERPDLDQLYMNAHSLLARGEGGGWPLTVFLTPELTPFYAGTYFPPQDRYGRPGFSRLLTAIVDAWTQRREELAGVGEQVAAALQSLGNAPATEGEPRIELLQNAVRVLRRIFDSTHGGFGSAPKFPHSLDLQILLRISHRFGSSTGLDMVKLTLEKMAQGGMYDQIGGGFHRYSVDAIWLVPHFEKMLYDNALLPPAYIEAYQITGDPYFRQITCETLDYVLQEMTSPPGGFYSTLDADSEGEEGKFYVWTEQEVMDLLGPDLGMLARAIYGITPAGNFEGHSILFRSQRDEALAERFGLPVETLQDHIRTIKATLYKQRSKRIWPGRDEKILTSWNALMIAAFAQAGTAFAEPKYTQAAVTAARFVLDTLRDSRGRLYRTCAIGQPAKLNGYLEDYAYLVDAFVTLYEATFDPQWIVEAQQLCQVMIEHFWDEASGGFYYTADDHERLIARSKDQHDGSMPSGNATAARALLRLSALLGNNEFRTYAERTLKANVPMMNENPAAAGMMLMAVDWYLGPVQEIAVIGRPEDPEVQGVLTLLRSGFAPRRVVAFAAPDQLDAVAGTIPLLAHRTMVDERVTVYCCEHGVCQAPWVGLEQVQAGLEKANREATEETPPA